MLKIHLFFFCQNGFSSKLYMNVNIIKTRIFPKMKFDLEGHAMESLRNFSLSDLLILLQP